MTEGRRAWTTNVVALSLVALSVAAIGPAYVNHDAAWYLYVVQRWFSGAVLYRDVIDTNPPLIIWLSAVPASLSLLGGVSATALFKLFVFAIAAASAMAVRATARRRWPQNTFALVTWVVFLAFPFVKADFGQREHFAVLLTLPYVFLSADPRTDTSGWLRWSAGAAAGLGFSIKPHFFVAWAAIEAMMFRHERGQRFRHPEFLAVVVVGGTYALAVLGFTPQYLEVAAQVRAVYSGLDSSPAVLLRLREVQLWFVAVAVVTAVKWTASDRLPGALFAAGTGFLASALLQRKGWGYQLYPARVFLLLFLAVAAASVLDRVPGVLAILRGGRQGLGIALAAALAIASVRYIAESRRPATPDLVAPLVRELEHANVRAAGPLTILSMRTIIYPAFPAVNYAGVRWGLRHNSLWFLPGLYADQDRASGGPLEPHSLDSMSSLERMFFDQVADDLCESPPGLLAFEPAIPVAPAGRRSLDLSAYYKQSPRLKPLLDAYAPRGTVGPFTLLAATSKPSCR